MAPTISSPNNSSSLEIAHSNQDLIDGKATNSFHCRTNRRFILITIVMAVVILALIIAVIAVVITGNTHQQNAATPQSSQSKSSADQQTAEATRKLAISLEDVLSGRLNPKPFNATWTSDSELLYKNSDGDLVLHNLNSSSDDSPASISGVRVLLRANDPIMETAFQYSISADKTCLCVFHFFQKIYRYSFKTRLTLIRLSSGQRIPLHLDGNYDFSLFQWSPVGTAFIVVHETNIYYQVNVSTSLVALTNDTGFVTNGIPDWVYEEEVFSSNSAVWFSPDGQHLSYARFEDSHTPLMVLPIYGQPGSPAFQYPRAAAVRYPKAGAPNPTVSLHCIQLTAVIDQYIIDNINSNTSIEPIAIHSLAPPNATTVLGTDDVLLTSVTWLGNGSVLATWMNRIQNKAVFVVYDGTNFTRTTHVHTIQQEGGWLDIFKAPVISSLDGTKFALILSQDQGGTAGSYRHLVQISTLSTAASSSSSSVKPLTYGAFVVTDVVGWHPKQNSLYYLATTVNDPGVQHLYAVTLRTGAVHCISCAIKSVHTNRSCLYNTAVCSNTRNCQYILLECNGPDVPHSAIYASGNTEKAHLLWETNVHLVAYVKSRRMPQVKRISVEIADGQRAQILLQLPPNVTLRDLTVSSSSSSSRTIKYPMVVNVYAGPDSYQVVQRFQLDWGSYLAANHSVIYAAIDGRGSGLKGDKCLFATYRRLGGVEVEDQINVTSWLQRRFPAIDANRTAIWGWSYGGYAAAMALATDTRDVFQCGMSVAPVTDWTLYDSIYTERFMGLPSAKDNLKGYHRASLLKRFNGLRGKQYFLVHGTFDDNVHYQQSMMWAKVLEQNDILFRQQSYPDEDHGLASVRPHLYHSLEAFLRHDCFQKADNK